MLCFLWQHSSMETAALRLINSDEAAKRASSEMFDGQIRHFSGSNNLRIPSQHLVWCQNEESILTISITFLNPIIVHSHLFQSFLMNTNNLNTMHTFQETIYAISLILNNIHALFLPITPRLSPFGLSEQLCSQLFCLRTWTSSTLYRLVLFKHTSNIFHCPAFPTLMDAYYSAN